MTDIGWKWLGIMSLLWVSCARFATRCGRSDETDPQDAAHNSYV